MDRKMISLLALCSKAGKLVAGEFACEKALQNGTAHLVIVATDASNNTKKKFINKSFYYKVDAFEYSNREELSRAIGKENRVTIAITDENFSNGIKNIITNDVGVENMHKE